jgi:drug/metabolite transporter (DMT)-like permease
MMAPMALRDPPALGEQWRRNALAIVTVGVLSPLAYLMVLYAMRRAPLAYVAPARELSLLIGMVLGALVLREAVGAVRLLGGGAMLAGVVLLALAR